ncbi:hypothetical protein KMZ30_07470 [Phycicoccus sp. KQZ13P-1]|uniref:hypothetical protein n=1 Tax=Phycicoccus mangrovi TaxID=2840470 RepID=UPI001C000B16|nr:hypothetical protein [Phycicoccus mangrovi]MBT9255411.1 hypothetical protein [Phycicoccus mangrovi]
MKKIIAASTVAVVAWAAAFAAAVMAPKIAQPIHLVLLGALVLAALATGVVVGAWMRTVNDPGLAYVAGYHHGVRAAREEADDDGGVELHVVG